MASPMSTLPTDLLFQILCYSDPRDIIRWRTVSKGFNAITHEMTLWKTLYRNAPFPRPPGPFSTQTVMSLERTLLKAMRLAESWTTRPMRALLSHTINTGADYTPPKIISGRWFVVFESSVRRFVLHDVDPAARKHTQQVLWEQETPQVSAWDLKSIISPEGHCVVYVSLRLRGPPGWRLLEIRLNSDTGELLHSAAMDPPHDGSESDISFKVTYAGNSQLLFIPANTNDHMVLDTRTHIFYKVRVSSKVRLAYSQLNWIMFSDTSLISFCHSHHKTTIYVFRLLPGAAGETTSPQTLCLTHKGITDAHLSRFKFMKPAIDLATEATNIKLLDYSMDLDPLKLTCVEMTLQKCSPGEVLPINIETRDIELPRERVRLSCYENHCKYIDVSDDGQIRGFFRAYKRGPTRPWNDDENQLVMKFAIDTTQDPWVIARSQIAPAEWSNEVDPSVDLEGEDIAFDGMHGQLCYAHPDVEDIVIVADIE